MQPASDPLQPLLWAALEAADLGALQQLSERNIDWNQLHEDAIHGEVLNQTPLLKALEELFRKPTAKRVDVLEWLVRQGADPSLRFPTNSRCAVRISTGIRPVDGVSVLHILRLPCLVGPENDDIETFLSAAVNRLITASLESASHRHNVRVDQSVVDLWERVLGSTGSHDVAFRSADEVVTAHSIVLLEASPVLKAMLASPMKEGQTREIEVRDASSTAVQLFLEVLYTCSTRLEPSCPDVLAALDLAHRWQVVGVVAILAELLKEHINETNFPAIAEAAVLKDLAKLKEACKAFFGKAPKTTQNELKKKGCPPAVQDLPGTAAPPASQSDKKRRRL